MRHFVISNDLLLQAKLSYSSFRGAGSIASLNALVHAMPCMQVLILCMQVSILCIGTTVQVVVPVPVSGATVLLVFFGYYYG